ncbi:TasA family protein [Clostridium sp.]|uniref:TasA family protein n=1 Tax=Clostridium sp. TaxID=1506 RepID=UPI003F3D637B
MKKNKKVVLLATALVSSAIIIGATYAWFTAEETVLNNFNSKNVIGVDLVEDFDSIGAGDLKPGVTINKRVSVIQTGTGSAVTRVRLEEMLQKFEAKVDGGLAVYNEVTSNPADASLKAVTISKEGRDAKINALGLTQITDTGRILGGSAPVELLVYEKQTASVSGTTYQYIGFNKIDDDTYQLVDLTTSADKITGVTYQFNKKLDAVTAIHLLNNGDTALDPDHGDIILTLNGTKVKPIANWTGPEDAWFYDTDGWAYYGKLLSEGTSTPTLLETVELDKKVGNEANDIDYKINVRMQAVQPTWEAIEAEWKIAPVTQNVSGNFEIIGPTTLSAEAQAILIEIIAPRN